MTIKDIINKYNITQTTLAKRLHIPLRTVQHWCGGDRNPPDYVTYMADEILRYDYAFDAAEREYDPVYITDDLVCLLGGTACCCMPMDSDGLTPCAACQWASAPDEISGELIFG